MRMNSSNTIRLKGIIMEDFCNYRSPSMFLITCFCNWKCCIDGNFDKSVCQNSNLSNLKINEYNITDLCERYLNNPLTSAIVIGGLEPLLQVDEILALITELRVTYKCNDDIVIYTGYTEDEVTNNLQWNSLRQSNVIIKYGRFVPNNELHYDEVLGVRLASDNQYAVRY